MEDAFADRFRAVDEFFFHALELSLQILRATRHVVSDNDDGDEHQGEQQDFDWTDAEHFGRLPVLLPKSFPCFRGVIIGRVRRGGEGRLWLGWDRV